MNTNRISIQDLTLALDNGMDVYRHYISYDVPLRKKILSPLRNERDPSFSLYQHNRTGEVWFSDFGYAKGNHWSFVMTLFGLDFKDAVEKVKADVLHMGNVSYWEKPPIIQDYRRREIEPLMPVVIEPRYKDWEQRYLDWFAKSRIPEMQLNRYMVSQASSYLMRKQDAWTREVKEFVIHERPGDPIFIIDFPSGRRKVYRPFNSKFKWLSNTVAEEDVFGLHLLPEKCENLFMLAGNRDTMSFNTVTGLYTFALNSETADMPDWLLLHLKNIAKNHHVLYDNDPTGERQVAKFEQLGFKNHLYLLKEFNINDFTKFVEEQPHNIPKFRSMLEANL